MVPKYEHIHGCESLPGYYIPNQEPDFSTAPRALQHCDKPMTTCLNLQVSGNTIDLFGKVHSKLLLNNRHDITGVTD